MGFIDGKPFIATKEHCSLHWGGRKDGGHFRCFYCGHKFVEGDTVRWQFTNDVKSAGGNPFVCQKCDGTKEEIVAKILELRSMDDNKTWWVNHFKEVQ